MVDVMVRVAQPTDAAGIARVHVDSWREAYRGIIPGDHLAALSYDDRTERWKDILAAPDDSLIVVATDEQGRVVGFASGGPERAEDAIYTGELYAIYSLAAYHGQGIGRRLVRAVVDYLNGRGLRSMLVWVLEDNHPARRFYEALGGKEVRDRSITIAGATLGEVAYGWTSTDSLLTEKITAHARE